MARTRSSLVQERFARQAKAFARSPLQRDPERLRRLLAFAAPRRGESALDVGCGPGIVRLRDPAHARTLTRGELRSMAEAAGLAAIREEPVTFVIDFEEWIDRAYPAAASRRRARAMMEACLEEDRAGLRVWREGRRLKFERTSLLMGAVRPR